MFKSAIGFILILFLTGLAQEDVSSKIEEFAKASRAFRKIEQKASLEQFRRLQKPVTPDSADFDQLYYDLRFEITTTPRNLTGTVTGRFKSNVNGLNQIKLNFDSREDLTPWQNFSVSGNVDGFFHSNWVLRINLDKPYNAGDIFSLTIQYAGVPRQTGFKGFEFDQNAFDDTVISTLSEPYSAQTWWPCKDDPSDKLDSVKITATVPAGMTVASNGLLEKTIDNPNNTTTFTWNEKYPITTYLISLAIANYATFSDQFEYEPGKFMPIDYFVYPQRLDLAREVFQKLPQMLQVYSQTYGMYPFVQEKYGQAEFEWGGAMEHQTCTSIGRVTSSWETVYAHELSHQWFGDLVTCRDWHNIWMNEGFATFSEAIWLEQAYGKSAYHSYVDSYQDFMDSWAVQPIYRFQIDDPGFIFHRTVYTKGMWVLHMLRHVLGDSVFFEIMRNYPTDPQFAHRDVTTEDFRDFCENISGMNLDWFFQQWIYQPFYPVYRWGYLHQVRSNEHFLEILIEQNQLESGYHHLYKMPVDLLVNYSNGTSDTLVVWDSLQTQSFQIPIKSEPSEVIFDPDNWLLKKTEKLSAFNLQVNLSAGFELYQNFPNPFNSVTHLPFSLDTSGQVTLEIYDVTGRKIKTLAKGFLTRGDILTWNGMDDSGRQVASGVYIYRIRFRDHRLARKMILIR